MLPHAQEQNKTFSFPQEFEESHSQYWISFLLFFLLQGHWQALSPQKIYVPLGNQWEPYTKSQWKVFRQSSGLSKGNENFATSSCEPFHSSYAALVCQQSFYFPWSLYFPCRWRTEVQKGCQAERQVFCSFKSPVPCILQIPLPNFYH